ncbi:MAG TPA: hypothetical protein PLH98_11560, partial [Ruminococcus flavefaciens]|nr:hypothetical protein [Ruminococcus flavefaciens]
YIYQIRYAGGMMNKKFSQVAINLEQEDVKALSDMMRKDGFTDNMRSAFLRRLIRQEWQRQQEESDKKAEVKS